MNLLLGMPILEFHVKLQDYTDPHLRRLNPENKSFVLLQPVKLSRWPLEFCMVFAVGAPWLPGCSGPTGERDLSLELKGRSCRVPAGISPVIGVGCGV